MRARRVTGLAALLAGTVIVARPPIASRAPVRMKVSPNGAALVVQGALEQTRTTHFYDPSYVKLAYPGGDVPPDRGVCADVIVRAYRCAGVDLQQEVHEDMTRAFSSYPHLWRWGLAGPDANIDHRRVANLVTFFTRQGDVVNASSRAEDFLPGDVVAWDLGGGRLHTGIVVALAPTKARPPSIAHNIGAGVRVEDVLFSWKIVGHYRSFS
ncbi:MAG TPA: DUF1287 domain-containing protein [Planctomycetota bacterium]|nr:DUF1287 domain-containing protein [Planctomycetota bacterium]